jgi:hypothetical protein
MVDSVGIYPGEGSMVLTDGGPLVPYTFNGPGGSVSGTVTSGFNIGGVNTLEAIINNTGDTIYGPCSNMLFVGDWTQLGLTGTITYDLVPGPSVATLSIAGAALLGVRRGVRRTR